MEDRKRREIEHSDRRRSIVKGHEYQTDSSEDLKRADWVKDERAFQEHFSNMKFYSITRSSFAHRDACLYDGIHGLTVLDYCCGNGEIAVAMARNGAGLVHGIDLSPVAIENAKALSHKEGVADRCVFKVMDAEHTEFPDAFFDRIHEYGALHHLDLEAAYRELSRVLKPGGNLICSETMRHNPLIHWYRKSTMHLRTQWEVEHILGEPEIRQGTAYFESVQVRFFHLASLAAVPFRKFHIFPAILTVLEWVDGFLLHLPWIQRWAWIAVVIYSRPRTSRPLPGH